MQIQAVIETDPDNFAAAASRPEALGIGRGLMHQACH